MPCVDGLGSSVCQCASPSDNMRLSVTVPTEHIFACNTYDVHVEDSDTVAVLKQKIEVATGILASEQWLMSPWNDLTDATGKMADYCLHEDAVLCVTQYIWLFVRFMSGKTITLLAESCDPVSKLKCWIEDKTGIHPDEQQLCFDGQVLENSRTLGHYKVKDHSTLTVVWTPPSRLAVQGDRDQHLGGAANTRQA